MPKRVLSVLKRLKHLGSVPHKYRASNFKHVQLAEPVNIPNWDELMDISHIHKGLTEAKSEATAILEKLVKHSEAERRRLETVFDNLNEPIMLCSNSGIIETANRTMRQLLDLRTRDLVGKNIADIFPHVLSGVSLLLESERYLDFVECDRCGTNCITCPNFPNHAAVS